ncbi:MAG: endonuclease/exonuclease/phosphatase family protein, partial [Polyangiaceae bacterium]|nr:endonuclease/exonuclease/phosphatase family protein [Polyangiaceae bacterium]
VRVADRVSIDATVAEYRPGCLACGASSSAFANATVTQLVAATIRVIAQGEALPPAVRIGALRAPPTRIIENDAMGDVESGGVFDPANDGLDFMESLEGMRVVFDEPVVVGPTQQRGASREVAITIDSLATGRTARGGLLLDPTSIHPDFQPERFFLAASNASWVPLADVGDTLDGDVLGIVDYRYGKYTVELVAPATRIAGGLLRESVSLPEPRGRALDLASFNVENLGGNGSAAKYEALAVAIVDRLGAPDLLLLEEVQDDSGAKDDAVVGASVTAGRLVDAIVAAEGPRYAYQDIDPADGLDGGQPGGNIRVAFLYRTDRGLAFVERGAATAQSATHVITDAEGATTALSPGRIDPTNPAFYSSRKPLVGEFRFEGQRLVVIANHWNSKGGDDPAFGRFQPPRESSEAQRIAQAEVVARFVEALLAADPDARIVVAGDMNDFVGSAPLRRIADAGLSNLYDTIPPEERYSYVYQGASQALDHILVSARLREALVGFDVVHMNAEFVIRASDHDPWVARF